MIKHWWVLFGQWRCSFGFGIDGFSGLLFIFESLELKLNGFSWLWFIFGSFRWGFDFSRLLFFCKLGRWSRLEILGNFVLIFGFFHGFSWFWRNSWFQIGDVLFHGWHWWRLRFLPWSSWLLFWWFSWWHCWYLCFGWNLSGLRLLKTSIINLQIFPHSLTGREFSGGMFSFAVTTLNGNGIFVNSEDFQKAYRKWFLKIDVFFCGNLCFGWNLSGLHLCFRWNLSGLHQLKTSIINLQIFSSSLTGREFSRGMFSFAVTTYKWK